jgi:hypothetical protein
MSLRLMDLTQAVCLCTFSHLDLSEPPANPRTRPTTQGSMLIQSRAFPYGRLGVSQLTRPVLQPARHHEFCTGLASQLRTPWGVRMIGSAHTARFGEG